MHALDGNSPNSRPGMLSSPLLHAHFTSGPWRKSCTEFTPHSPTLVMSVIRTIKAPFLLPLTDENRRVWLGGSLFQLALGSSIDASNGRLSMRNSLYPVELVRPARPALDACAFRPHLTTFKLHLI